MDKQIVYYKQGIEANIILLDFEAPNTGYSESGILFPNEPNSFADTLIQIDLS